MFNQGEKVICIDNEYTTLEKYKVYTIKNVYDDYDPMIGVFYYLFDLCEDDIIGVEQSRFVSLNIYKIELINKLKNNVKER